MMPKRDRRLLAAMLLLVTAAIAGLVQAWIIRLHLDAAILGHWDWFADTFGVEAPASGPDKFCFDNCAPPLPLWAGWISLATFFAGLLALTRAWWRPRG
ncbi:hypothetical protein WG901_00100 [Novosphingobium sp. PS1R-30]|uniref:Transmembrane protein n=1 Tax=Novosphingobium anseongense TaxID=3133436 RepID=A0ABU8RQD7_9SPHN